VDTSVVTETPSPRLASFWQRRVVAPVVDQLQQGITPRRIAMAITLGALLGIFPVLGTTTMLCAFAAYIFRLNQPIIQAINFLVYPLQLALLIPLYRAGEHLLGRPPMPLQIQILVERFHMDTARFFADFGMIALGGVLVWAIAAPFLGAAIFAAVLPALRGLASRLRRDE
jgi:uncharacterized protein (DUF2062 family)